MRTGPRPLFWEVVRNAPPRPEGHPKGSLQGIRFNRMAQQMNEAIKIVVEERRRFQLIGIRDSSVPFQDR